MRRVLLAAIGASMVTARAATVESPAPRNVNLQIFDIGMALATELRQIVSPPGETEVRIRKLPAKLDPSSISVLSVAAPANLEILEQRFEYDVGDVARLLRRYLNQPVTAGSGGVEVRGRLIGLPDWRDPPFPSRPLVLARDDGSLLAFLTPREAGRLIFPDGGSRIVSSPTLFWRGRFAAEGPQAFRLTYVFEGLSWRAVYDLIMKPGAPVATLSGRIGFENRSGGSFEEVDVILHETERGRDDAFGGRDPSDPPPQRYLYGFHQPFDERALSTLAPLRSYPLKTKLSIADGETVFMPLVASASLPIRRVLVYDGVRFDRFQRNRRQDWNYGTEFHTTVDMYLEFDNNLTEGVGAPIPAGRIRLYEEREGGALVLLGEDALPPIPAGARGYVRLGPAPGLKGERERTGFTEIRPFHEYEESFEIRLSNDSDQAATLRVVEHLYRWNEFEIVKADAEYSKTGPQTIEFRVDLKPGGRRTIHYTVRYRW